MPHKVFFARHWHLEWKYMDYNNLSFEEMRDLWQNTYSYSIDAITIPEGSQILRGSDMCYTSFQNRAVGTSEALWFVSQKKTDSLNEIFFDLFQLMTKQEYISWGKLASVRIVLWKSFFDRRSWVESPESVMERIQSFVSEVSLLKEQNITAISHWFFLQMVKCFLLKWVDFTKISYEEFLNLGIGPIGYLESFEVTV